jgi:ADP-heptose:LPS heptosyltransferase
VQIFSALSISRLAAVIASAGMMVSNDTGPMHLGPAFGVPTIGIFSVGIPTHFRPTGVRDRFVQGNPIEKVGVDEVVRAVDQVWSSIDRRDPQR